MSIKRLAAVAAVLVSTSTVLTAAPAMAAVPDAPTNVRATLSGNKATVTFSPAASVLPGTTYELVCAKATGEILPIVKGAASPLEMPGLQTAVKYACSVRAVEGLNMSVWATATPNPLIIPGAPEAVTRPYAIAGSGSATLFFNTTSLTASYEATCLPSNGAAAVTSSAKLAPIVVTGMTAGVVHNCAIVAVVDYNGTRLVSPATMVEVTPAVPTASAPSVPSISDVTATSGLITVTVLPSFTGGAATSFTATCTTAGQAPLTATSTSARVAVPVTAEGTYVCNARAINSYGTSPATANSVPVAAKVALTTMRAPTIKLGAYIAGETTATATAAVFPDANAYTFTCRGASGSTAGREVWQLSTTPTARLSLTAGDWNCYVRATTPTKTTADSVARPVSVMIAAPSVSVSRKVITMGRPSGFGASWSAVCLGSNGAQAAIAGTTSKLKLTLTRGSWKCSAVEGSIVSAPRSVRIA